MLNLPVERCTIVLPATPLEYVTLPPEPTMLTFALPTMLMPEEPEAPKSNARVWPLSTMSTSMLLPFITKLPPDVVVKSLSM